MNNTCSKLRSGFRYHLLVIFIFRRNLEESSFGEHCEVWSFLHPSLQFHPVFVSLFSGPFLRTDRVGSCGLLYYGGSTVHPTVSFCSSLWALVASCASQGEHWRPAAMLLCKSSFVMCHLIFQFCSLTLLSCFAKTRNPCDMSATTSHQNLFPQNAGPH